MWLYIRVNPFANELACLYWLALNEHITKIAQLWNLF